MSENSELKKFIQSLNNIFMNKNNFKYVIATEGSFSISGDLCCPASHPAGHNAFWAQP